MQTVRTGQPYPIALPARVAAGRRLKAARVLAGGISLLDAARRTGVSYQHLVAVEHGQHPGRLHLGQPAVPQPHCCSARIACRRSVTRTLQRLHSHALPGSSVVTGGHQSGGDVLGVIGTGGRSRPSLVKIASELTATVGSLRTATTICAGSATSAVPAAIPLVCHACRVRAHTRPGAWRPLPGRLGTSAPRAPSRRRAARRPSPDASTTAPDHRQRRQASPRQQPQIARCTTTAAASSCRTQPARLRP